MDSIGWGGRICILCGVFKSKLGFLSEEKVAPLLAEEVAAVPAFAAADTVEDAIFFCCSRDTLYAGTLAPPPILLPVVGL